MPTKVPRTDSLRRLLDHCLRAALLAPALFLIACATVNPVLLTPGDRTTPGIRFYEMRPFMLVQKPFPIWARTIFVDARISADGRNAKILGQIPTDFIKAFLVSDASNNLSTRSITVAPSPSGPNAQAGETQVPPTTPAAKPPSTTPSAAQQQTTPTNKPGSGSIAYQVDKDGTPIVPVNDLFSIVYLPDYDREYAVSLRSHFGFAKINVTVAPGGGLLAYNGEVDNSQLVGPLVDLYTNLVKEGGAVAAAAINPHAAAISKLTPSAQAGQTIVPGTQPALTPASIVTLRLTIIRYALPGPHRILKKDEHPIKIDPDSGLVSMDTGTAPAAYQVDYRYFEVPIAEALLDPPSALSVSTAAAIPGDQAHGNGNTCAASKMLAKSEATPLGMGKILSKIKSDIKVTDATAQNIDSNNCVGEIDVKATIAQADGTSAPFADSDGSVTKQFQQTGYSGTKLVFQ